MKIKEVILLTGFGLLLIGVAGGLWAALGVSYAGYIRDPGEPAHTWIEDLPDDKIENDYTDDHYRFPVQLTNGGLKTAKLVTDVLTGDQAYVVGKPWIENGRQCYRILREARTDIYVFIEKPGDNPSGKGWVKEHRIADTWIIETRALEELTPGPSA